MNSLRTIARVFVEFVLCVAVVVASVWICNVSGLGGLALLALCLVALLGLSVYHYAPPAWDYYVRRKHVVREPCGRFKKDGTEIFVNKRISDAAWHNRQHKETRNSRRRTTRRHWGLS